MKGRWKGQCSLRIPLKSVLPKKKHCVDVQLLKIDHALMSMNQT